MSDTIISLIGELCPFPLSAEEIESSTELLTGGVIDSLGLLQVVEAVERSTGVTVPPGDITIDNFNSVAAIRRLQTRLAAAG